MLSKFIKGSKLIFVSTILLVIYGSIMIYSAEMGNSVGDSEYLRGEVIKQTIYAFLGLIIFFICSVFPINRVKLLYYYVSYFVVLFLLVICRGFAPVGGAYAWIRIGPISFQPSEIAKVFTILFASKLLSINSDKYLTYFKHFVYGTLLYVFIIVFIQKDLGSGVVLFIIAFFVCLIPVRKEIRKIQIVERIALLVGIALVVLAMMPFVNEWLKKFSSSYQVARFLAANNPFEYRYDLGYHLIMSLVSFAQGGLFGRGYGNSIHKYMNFPNPSSDFILAVIVEEFGFVGFLVFAGLYLCILFTLMKQSLKSDFVSVKIILLGTFLYFVVHFILNVGGVSGLIPLTGVPLLLMSAGGSSLLCGLASLGLCQSVIETSKNNENNSRKI